MRFSAFWKLTVRDNNTKIQDGVGKVTLHACIFNCGSNAIDGAQRAFLRKWQEDYIHRVSKKLCQLRPTFCSLSVKYEPISIKIVRVVSEETLNKTVPKMPKVGILGTVLWRVSSGTILPIFVEIGSYLSEKEQKINWHSFFETRCMLNLLNLSLPPLNLSSPTFMKICMLFVPPYFPDAGSVHAFLEWTPLQTGGGVCILSFGVDAVLLGFFSERGEFHWFFSVIHVLQSSVATYFSIVFFSLMHSDISRDLCPLSGTSHDRKQNLWFYISERVDILTTFFDYASLIRWRYVDNIFAINYNDYTYW